MGLRPKRESTFTTGGAVRAWKDVPAETLEEHDIVVDEGVVLARPVVDSGVVKYTTGYPNARLRQVPLGHLVRAFVKEKS